jgi:hypothetical protein
LGSSGKAIGRMLLTERMAAHLLKLPAGSIITCDRAYNDRGLSSQWTEAGGVLRDATQGNAVFEVIEDRPVARSAYRSAGATRKLDACSKA